MILLTTQFKKTLEECEFPDVYYQHCEGETQTEVKEEASYSAPKTSEEKCELTEQHLTFRENQRGVSFENLFGPYLKGAKKIIVTDPYIRLFYQQRNFMELLQVIVKQNWPMSEVEVHLVTIEDELKADVQTSNFERMRDAASQLGVNFTWEYDYSRTSHARHIETDTGWKILLDRGLDVYQEFPISDVFEFSNKIPELRTCKAFEATFLKQGPRK